LGLLKAGPQDAGPPRGCGYCGGRSYAISSDDSLPSRTSLVISDLKHGLELCFNSTISSFKNSLYKRTFGTTMISCISPIIANIYMEHIEHKAITTFHSSPSPWPRYVDDTFCILDKEHITDFYKQLNSICSHIQFTMEIEHNSSFLDVLVTRDSRKENTATHNTTLSTMVYKKTTHIDRYLHFTSHHPKHQKLTVAKTDFQPELPFLLPLNHALVTRNTNTSFPFFTFKARRKKLEEF